MRQIHNLQSVFDEFGVRPAYLADYPIVSQEESLAPLRMIRASGRCEIGAHLHPWVTPPFEEDVNSRNSYPGNLPLDLERRKLQALARRIEEGLGVRPQAYKAGRYGFGPNTAKVLRELSFGVDLSFCPGFDFSADGGPDHSARISEPRWLSSDRSLLSLPKTVAFVGWLRSQNLARAIHRIATHAAFGWTHAPGLLARTGLIDRLGLLPERYTLTEMCSLTRFLFRRGSRVFTFALHSPSILPGCTPYVRNERERDELLQRCRGYFQFFLGDLNGISMTPLELKRYLGTAA